MGRMFFEHPRNGNKIEDFDRLGTRNQFSRAELYSAETRNLKPKTSNQ